MNALAHIIASTIALLVVNFAALIGNIVNGRPPRWVQRWARNARRGAEIAAGLAGVYLVLSVLLVVAGITRNNSVTMYVGLSLLAIFSIGVKSLLSLCEELAKTVWVRLAWLATFGNTNTTIPPKVHDGLVDISMCLFMCSVFALDGQDIGLTLNAIGWASIASLVALVIMSGAQITIRRKVMGGLTALFVIAFVLFQFMPASRELALATAEHLQVGVRRASDVVRPAMPLAEVRLHQETEQNVLQSELVRYTQKVTDFQRAAADHTPTPAEIDEYQKALENVTTLRQALKLHHPESSTTEVITRITLYTVLGLLVFAAAFFLVVLPIIKAMPSGGIPAAATAGTPAQPGAPATPATPTPAPAVGGRSFPWQRVFGTIAAVTVVALLFFIAFRMIDQSAHAQPQPWVNPLPLPASSPVVTPTPPTSANLEDFRVLKDGTADGVWEFQLDAREPWKTLPISFTGTDDYEVEFTTSGQVCGGPNIGCVGPNGQNGPAKLSTNNSDEFPAGEAFAQALVARIGSDIFSVGGHKTITVHPCQSVELMDNYRMPYIAMATGGFRVNITVRKK